MEYRKSLIGAASILALSVGMNQAANAALSQPASETKAPMARDLTSAVLDDPLLELIVRTQGTFTEETVRSTLASMYSQAGELDVELMPELLANIANLGVPSNVVAAAKAVLIDIVSAAEASEMLKADVLAQLEIGDSLIQLAQSTQSSRQRCVKDPNTGRLRCTKRDPREVGQTRERGRSPSEIGQVGGGGY